MTARQVRDALGEPLRSSSNSLGEDVLDYDSLLVSVSPSTGVVEVGIRPLARPTISGIEVFASPQALRRLSECDGAPHEVVGFLVFLNLGITVTGLHDGDQSQRAVTAFARGRWDDVGGMKPFALEN